MFQGLKFFEDSQHELLLVFQMNQDSFYFYFGLFVGGIIELGPGFGMSSLDILADHDQGHEMNLNEVGDKQPEDEGRIGIKAQRGGSKDVPGQPGDGPKEDDEEEAHSANLFGGKDS